MQCEGSMKTKFEGINEKFCKEVGRKFTNFKGKPKECLPPWYFKSMAYIFVASGVLIHKSCCADLFSKFEVEKEKLAVECELQSKCNSACLYSSYVRKILPPHP
jgi:hypothetical protein